MSSDRSKIVFIGMSVYNGGLVIERAIESVRDQTFKNFKLFIIDDCSDDETWDIVSKYAMLDERIHGLKRNENFGLTKNLIELLNFSKCFEFFARIDADDQWKLDKLEKQVEFLNENPGVIVCGTNFHLTHNGLRQDANKLETGFIGKSIFARNPFLHSSVVLRVGAMGENNYSSDWRYSQDYELWLRLSKLGQLHVMPEILATRHTSSNSISYEKMSNQLYLSLKARKTHIDLKNLSFKVIFFFVKDLLKYLLLNVRKG